jgi:hypothetical protein
MGRPESSDRFTGLAARESFKSLTPPQKIGIKVVYDNPGLRPSVLMDRLNSLDLADVQDKIMNPLYVFRIVSKALGKFFGVIVGASTGGRGAGC